MRSAALLLIALALGASSTPAVAETPTVADTPAQAVEAFNTHIARALKARSIGAHGDAIAALDDAIEAIRTSSGESYDKARSRAFYYKATSLMELRRYRQALSLLDLLRTSPGLSSRERLVVKERLSQARKLLAIEDANQPGELTVSAVDETGAPMRAASVSVDGKLSPPPPFSVRLAPGPHVIRLFSGGKLVDVQRVEVAPGSEALVVMRPAPLPAWRPPTGAWALLGSAVASGVVGGVLQAFAASDYDAASNTNLLWREANARLERGDRLNTAGYGMYGLAGTLALTAGVWLLADGLSFEPTLQLGPAQGDITAGIGGSF